MKTTTVILVFLLQISLVSAMDLTITEIYYDAPGSDKESEFVEIKVNVNNLNLTNYTITTFDNDEHLLPYINNLNSGDFILVKPKNGVNDLDAGDGLAQIFMNRSSFLTNSGDEVAIYDSDGVLVDFVRYEGGNDPVQGTWPSSDSGIQQDNQLESIQNDGTDLDNSSNWFSLTPNPGAVVPKPAPIVLDNTTITSSTVTGSTVLNSTIVNSVKTLSTILFSTNVFANVLRSVEFQSTVTDTDIEDSDVNQSIVDDSDIEDSKITGSELTSSNVKDSILKSVNCDTLTSDNVNLTNIGCVNSEIDDSDLLNTDLTNSKVTKTKMSNSDIDASTIDKTTGADNKLDNVETKNLLVFRSNLSNGDIQQANIFDSNLDQTDTNDSTIDNSEIIDSKVDHSSVIDSTLEDLMADNIDVDDVNITKGIIYNSQISDALMFDVVINNSNIQDVIIESSFINNSNLTNAIAVNANLVNVELFGVTIIGSTIIFDVDHDVVSDTEDNCPNIFNPNQEDNDNDGLGNVCDETPGKCTLETNTGQENGVGVGVSVCPEVFDTQIWLCNSKVNILDYNGRSQQTSNPMDSNPRKSQYAFEGEEIIWTFLVYNKDDIDKVTAVLATISNEDEDLPILCEKTQGPLQIPLSCDARLDRTRIELFDSNKMSYYQCSLTADSQENMFGLYSVSAKAFSDVTEALIDEPEIWYMNPNLGLMIEGNLEFNEINLGDWSYSKELVITSLVDSGSDVMMDMFISGTNFSSSSHASCPNNNLPLENFRYYSSNGAFNTNMDLQIDDSDLAEIRTKDDQGYVSIQYAESFSSLLYDEAEIIQANLVDGYYSANIISPNVKVPLKFKVLLPEQCTGTFDQGSIYIWGEAI